MDLNDITTALKSIPLLNAILYPTAILLGYILRVCCGVFRSFDMRRTALLAGIFGVIGALLQLTRGGNIEWREVALQAIALGAAVFIVERLLNKLAEAKALPFLPRDNEWVKEPLPLVEQPKPREVNP